MWQISGKCSLYLSNKPADINLRLSDSTCSTSVFWLRDRNVPYIVDVLIWSVAAQIYLYPLIAEDIIRHLVAYQVDATRMALIMMSVLQLHNVPCMIGTENSADAMYSHVVHVLLI